MQVPVLQGCQLSPDKEVLDVGSQFERVAIGDNEVGKLALLNGPDLIPEAKNLRGINRDGLERLIVRQAVRDGVRSVLSQSPREGIIKASDGELHARSGKLRRSAKQPIVRIILIGRERKHRAQDDGHTFRAEKVLYCVG